MLGKIVCATVFGIILATGATASEFKRIETKAEYLNVVAGKRMVAEWGWVTAAADGNLTGKVNGQAAQGKWDWKNGFWCRTISFGSTNMPRNCQAIFVSGDNLVSIRDKGQGKQTRMKIK